MCGRRLESTAQPSARHAALATQPSARQAAIATRPSIRHAALTTPLLLLLLAGHVLLKAP